ncbi:DUF397 domain-containing protein [Streptomyces sp. NPDC012421]|uniref:DUF397 domain-containing protein n=1 Tax=Streptomyces sp. NPDC012421 TaxID=3364832 RepID=UPI0036E01B8E
MTTDYPRWLKSVYRNGGIDGVEVAHNLLPTLGLVPLRDAKAGPSLVVSAAFIEAVKQ